MVFFFEVVDGSKQAAQKTLGFTCKGQYFFVLFEWKKCHAIKAVVAPGQALLLASCTNLCCDQMEQSWFCFFVCLCLKKVVASLITFFPFLIILSPSNTRVKLSVFY